METIVLFTSSNDIGEEFQVHLEGKSSSNQLCLKLSIYDEFGNSIDDCELIYEEIEERLIMTPPSLSTPPYMLCLASCGLGSLATEVMDCRKEISRKSKRVTSRRILKCLKRKGHNISKSLTNCLIGCIPTLGGP